MAEPTLEQLYSKLETLGKVGSKMETFMAMREDNEKETAAKKAMEDKKHEEEKMEAKKAAKTAALKTAMEEPDEEKRDAAIRAAMEEDPKKHEAFGKPEHKAMSDEEKEKEAQVAAIIDEKKQTLINQILTAAKITHPQNYTQIETLVKSAGIAKLKEIALMTPTFEANTQTQVPEKFIPFYANMSQDIDNSQLTASSPDSDFNKFSTKELLEMSQ